jgi:hypothetical protein
MKALAWTLLILWNVHPWNNPIWSSFRLLLSSNKIRAVLARKSNLDIARTMAALRAGEE